MRAFLPRHYTSRPRPGHRAGRVAWAVCRRWCRELRGQLSGQLSGATSRKSVQKPVEQPSSKPIERLNWNSNWRRAAILLLWLTTGVGMAAEPVHFAVIGAVPAGPAQEAPVRDLLAAIADRPGIDFILDDGNLKGAQEPCTDTLLQQRQALLNSSPLPLVLVPGARDWVDCQQAAAGRFDPLERLDQLRELIFAGADSLGVATLPLLHESEFTRFRNFHENTEWQQGPVLFVTLNVPGNNNHYVDAGGRNGEFEDRTIANRFWLEHALRSARQHHPAAVVIAIEGDPGLGVQSRHGPFDWLDFRTPAQRDGYAEFKQDLLKFAQQFDGPVLLINQAHGHAGNPAQGITVTNPAFRLSQPLHHKNGTALSKLWQLELNAHNDPLHWVSVEIAPARETAFKASLQSVPAHPPTPAVEPATAASALPPVALPVPVLQIPGTHDDDSASNPRP
jgi:hypothetical protein